MAKYFGKVGFAVNTLTAPGVSTDVITETSYFGDIVRDTRQLREGANVNPDLSVNNSISIVADDFARQNILAIRYAEMMGVLWTVTDVTVQNPRLLLTLGSIYNGPKAGAPNSP